MRPASAILFALVCLLITLPVYAAPAPQFEAEGISGAKYSNGSLAGKTVVLEWFNTGCPFVRRVYDSGDMQRLQAEYTKKRFVWLTVNSTHEGHQDFLNAEKAKAVLTKWSSAPSDYVIDASGTIGKAFGAKSTPQLFVIDPKGNVLYQGAFDNYPEAGDEKEKLVPHFENALKEIAAGKPVSVPETPGYGCSIKYGS